MLASNISRNLCRARPRHFGGLIAHISVFSNGPDAPSIRRDSLRFLGKPIVPQRRRFFTQAATKLPPLFDEPQVLWPAFFKTIRNSFFVNMVVKSQYDQDFEIDDFITASKQALVVVGAAMSREDYDMLEGLVTNDVIHKLKERISKYTDEQKELLAMQSEDVYMTFPYEVGIIQEGDEGRERTFVEIMVVHHALRGLKQMKEAGNAPPLGMGMRPEYQERIFVANYRFIREYTKGIESSWIVNVVNHFMPFEL